jgi:hypothetical protein
MEGIQNILWTFMQDITTWETERIWEDTDEIYLEE